MLLLYFYDKVQKDGNRYVYLNIYTMYFISYFYLAEFPIISERLSLFLIYKFSVLVSYSSVLFIIFLYKREKFSFGPWCYMEQ